MKDAEEDFSQAKAKAKTTEERQALSTDLARFRRQHREEDIRRGKRAPGLAIRMHQIMWARWIEVAAAHEAAAAKAFDAICAGETPQLVDELRQSLVTVTAAASTVEAMYEDVKYLIPARPPRDTAAERICDGLTESFGLPPTESNKLLDQFVWLFDRRNEGLHAYSEPEAPQEHPSGVNTGAEASRFNGPEGRKALKVALDALLYAESPPVPANRWVVRWVKERKAYHETIVAPIRAAFR